MKRFGFIKRSYIMCRIQVYLTGAGQSSDVFNCMCICLSGLSRRLRPVWGKEIISREDDIILTSPPYITNNFCVFYMEI